MLEKTTINLNKKTLSQKITTWFRLHGTVEMRLKLALNPNTSEKILGWLVNKDKNIEVRKAVALNPLAVKLLEQAKKSGSAKELVDLGKKPFPCVRATVAENIFTPQNVLREFAEKESEHWMVRLSAAKNPNTLFDSVAIVLSKIRKSMMEFQVGTEIVLEEGERMSWCYKEDPEKVEVERPIYSVHEDYSSESLEIARQILEIHSVNREKVMNKLRELNPELYEALTKF